MLLDDIVQLIASAYISQDPSNSFSNSIKEVISKEVISQARTTVSHETKLPTSASMATTTASSTEPTTSNQQLICSISAKFAFSQEADGKIVLLADPIQMTVAPDSLQQHLHGDLLNGVVSRFQSELARACMLSQNVVFDITTFYSINLRSFFR